MEEHGFVTLLSGGSFREAGTTTLYLNATPSLLLNVLNVSTLVADDLGSEVEARQRLHVDSDLLLRPFSLEQSQLAL